MKREIRAKRWVLRELERMAQRTSIPELEDCGRDASLSSNDRDTV